MFSSSNLLIPALIFAAVGFLVGILIMSLVGDRRRRKEDADKTSLVMDDLIVPEMPSLPENRFESIAHLYQEKRSGRLVTDVKGKVYLNRGSIPEDQLRGLQEAARNWQTWLGIPAIPPLETPVMVPPVKETPVAAVSLSEPAASVSRVEKPAEPLPAALTGEAPKTEGAPVIRTGPLEKPRAKTMIGQIDDVLQEILPQTIYADINIHLGEEYTNGVVVWVGANKYIGIDAVPDAEIKALIQSAVRKWEATEGKV